MAEAGAADTVLGAGARARLHRRYGGYILALVLLTVALGALERVGVSRAWIAAIFLLAPVALYASIGLASRTTHAAEYFVAGRNVPAVYNGMAIAADWMSVASFMGLAGILYMSGHAGLAYVLGWTGGFCLIAFYLAPYLRKFGQFTIPDFLGERFASRTARLIGALVCVLCSFLYVVAQIYGVGLITSRLTGFSFEIGVFVGLGGVLVCSFLGGMRAVTWTQVAQYIMLLAAYLVPVIWLSVKQTEQPVPQVAFGEQLQRVGALERQLIADPKEREVVDLLRAEVTRHDARLAELPASFYAEREAAQRRVDTLAVHGASVRELRAAERALLALPKDAEAARESWGRTRDALEERAHPLGGLPPQAQPFAGDPAGDPAQRQAYADARLNFIALVFCLMAGTAGLPHVLGRFYTTSSVRESRRSVTWALLFIALVYLNAPVLAVLLKAEVMQSVVGLRFDQLPRWLIEWSRVDSALLSISDINKDGVLQFGELKINSDIFVLAAPEIGGMPFVISCMVAAGGLAAALSTADGLLLTIANALSHDLYFKMLAPDAETSRQVAISKVVLMVVALLAAYVATLRAAEIMSLVTPAFSIAAATLFPALVLGIFWKRMTGAGAVAGMLAGLAVTLYYLATTHPTVRQLFQVREPLVLWWGIQPASAGVFGVPVAFVASIVVSLLTPVPAAGLRLLEQIRRPDAG
jgi:cation/acetate symporter